MNHVAPCYRHEKECKFRTVSCPDRKCTAAGIPLFRLMGHILGSGHLKPVRIDYDRSTGAAVTLAESEHKLCYFNFGYLKFFPIIYRVRI